MAVININTISKLTENNPIARNVFVWTINFLLHLLESQRLIDRDKLYKVAIDWQRGSLDLGNSFTEQLAARTISQYVVDRYTAKWKKGMQEKDYETKTAFDR